MHAVINEATPSVSGYHYQLQVLIQETAMSIELKQFAASNKAAVDSLMAVANTALATAERVAALNLSVARSSMEDSVAAVKAVLEVKNSNEAAALQSSIVQPAFAKAADYSRSLFEISTESQQQFAKMLEGQFADFQKQLSSMVAQATKVAPAGTEPYVLAMQKSIDSANQAFVNMTTMAKQINETVQANLLAATKMR
jgi:phasin family protein